MIRILAVTVAAVLTVRAALFLVFLSFLLWRLFRESGYPWWIRAPAAAAPIAGFGWLITAGTFDKRQHDHVRANSITEHDCDSTASRIAAGFSDVEREVCP